MKVVGDSFVKAKFIPDKNGGTLRLSLSTEFVQALGWQGDPFKNPRLDMPSTTNPTFGSGGEGDIDGGYPDSNYGGFDNIDGGGVT